MTERENRHEGENSQSGRDGYKSYNREGYNRYNRNEGGNSYGRRPYNSNREGGERPYRSSYNPRFNSGNGEDRPQRGYGNRQQGARPYGNRPAYGNAEGGERSSYTPRYNNNNQGGANSVHIVRVSTMPSRVKAVIALSSVHISIMEGSKAVIIVRRVEVTVRVLPIIIRMRNTA